MTEVALVTQAARLVGQENLYAGLREFGAALPGTQLADVLSCLRALGDGGQAVAARLARVDQALLARVLGANYATDTLAQLKACLHATAVAPLFQPDIAQSRSVVLPTRGERPDMPAFSDRAFDSWFAAQNATYGLGLYGEKRSVYAADQFADAASPERREVHLGVDVFAPAGSPLYAPLAGQVAHVTYNADPLDYGHTLILRHMVGGVTFHTLYGHLGATLPQLLAPEDSVKPGQLIAHLGDWHENGGWAAHLHFQIITDMLDQTDGNFFGVGHVSLWDIWQQISPDPNLILQLPVDRFRL